MKINRGFTLIELLVVISIISLLSSIVLSTIQDAKIKAQGVMYRTYSNELEKVIRFCFEENNSYPTDSWVGYSNIINNNPCVVKNIKYQEPPNIISNPQYIYAPFSQDNGFLSCNSDTISAKDEPFLLYFSSSKQLNIPRMYFDGTVSSPSTHGTYYYCVSPRAH